MKTVSKKLFGMLLVLVLLVSAVPFQAFAENDCTVNADVVLNGSTIASVTVTTTANVGDILNVQEDAAVVSAIQSFYGSDADGFSVSSVTHNGSNVDGKAVSVNGNMNLCRSAHFECGFGKESCTFKVIDSCGDIVSDKILIFKRTRI